MTSADVREYLIGPDKDSPHGEEILPQPPSRWYLTGFLVPQNAPEPQRCDDNGADECQGKEKTPWFSRGLWVSNAL